MIGSILVVGSVSVVIMGTLCAVAWYRIVDPSEAHLVVTPRDKFVVSSDSNVSTNNIKTYFAIPSSIPFFGRAIRRMDVTIKELVLTQETYEKDQARYKVKSSLKYRISDVQTAAETFINDEELQEQLKEVVRSSVRAVTVQYDVVNARSKKQEMESKIRLEMQDDLKQWGLSLISFQLVDFQDTDSSNIISNISKRREKEIESTTREQIADKDKSARIKEAESIEKARQREIEAEQRIGEQEQKRNQKISEMEKDAKEKAYAVKQVEIVREAEIEKEKAEVEANQNKEVALIYAEQEKQAEFIRKEQKQLEGEGDKLKAEEIAKGQAAPIIELGNAEAAIIKAKGLAEAEAKEKLQEALNKFGDEAIRALVAEKIVAKDEAIGIATAQALQKADIKLFSGGESDKAGFNLGKLIESASVASESSADAILNKVSRPNDLGFTALGMQKVADDKKVSKKKKKSSSLSSK